LQPGRELLARQAREYGIEFGGGSSGEMGGPKLFSLLDDSGRPLKGQALQRALAEANELAEPQRQQRSEQLKQGLAAELKPLQRRLEGNRVGTYVQDMDFPARLVPAERAKDPTLDEDQAMRRIGQIRQLLAPRRQGDPDAAVVRTPRTPEATPMPADSGEDFANRMISFARARQGTPDKDVSYVAELPNVGNPPRQPLTTPGAARIAATPAGLSTEQEDMAWRRALAARISAVASGVDSKGQPKAAFGPLGIEGRRKGHELKPWNEPSPQMLQMLARRFNL
jgi:hypothetical protein